MKLLKIVIISLLTISAITFGITKMSSASACDCAKGQECVCEGSCNCDCKKDCKCGCK